MDGKIGWAGIAALALVLGCGPDTASDAGESEHVEWPDGRTLTHTWMPSHAKRVDLIMVVDDSPSMRAHLPTMAANVGAFADIFMSLDPALDVRVAITTTSVAGPTCAGAEARGGTPILESCRAHLDDFSGPDEHGEAGGESLDLTELCEDWCGLETLERVASPGSTSAGGLAIRPWLDSDHAEFGTNLAEGVDYREALGCALMQGFGGCQFESPIEAAARLVERYADPQDPMFGFRRPDAHLMVIVISDEDDCSHPDSSGVVFDPAGERVFWPAGASDPLSAICVNASLSCEGEGCELLDHALSGEPTTNPEVAVLSPPSRLLDAMQAAGEYQLESYAPLVGVVGGASFDGGLIYAQPEPGSDHASYAEAFGIGPGCVASSGEGLRYAAPPGRLAQLVSLAGGGDLHPICGEDWSPVVSPFATSILPQLPPACMPDAERWGCIEDLDPQTGLLEPDCVLERVHSGGMRDELALCERDVEGWSVSEDTHDFVVPEGEDSCWVYLTDFDNETPSTTDDLSEFCVENESLGEFKLTRREGSYEPYDSYYALRCRPC